MCVATAVIAKVYYQMLRPLIHKVKHCVFKIFGRMVRELGHMDVSDSLLEHTETYRRVLDRSPCYRQCDLPVLQRAVNDKGHGCPCLTPHINSQFGYILKL